MGKVQISKALTTTTLFTNEGFTSGVATSAALNVSRFDEVAFYASGPNTADASFAATLTAQVSPDGTNYFPFSQFRDLENLFTNASLFTNENFTTGAATVSSILNISRFEDIVFYGDMNATGAAGLAATLTASISRDGSSFNAFPGFLRLDNLGQTAVSQVTFNTSTSEVFSMKNIGAIHSIRFSLTMANQIASTTFNLRYSGRVKEKGISSFTLNTSTSRSFAIDKDDLGGIHSIRFTLTMAGSTTLTTQLNLRYSARTQDV